MDWPAPEVACRLAEPGEIPRGAAAVLAVAEAAGWTVEPTYARGTSVAGPNSKPRHGRVVDSIALRMRRGLDRAVAVWVDGRFDLAYAWSVGATGGFGHRRVNVTQLREELAR